MKKLILPVLALLFCSMTSPTDCSRFRNGKFRSSINGAPYFIERKGDFQREYVLGSPDSAMLTFHVKWISDCTYTVDPTDETRKKIPQLPKDAILTSEIISTTDSTYTTRSTSNFATLVDTVTFARVN